MSKRDMRAKKLLLAVLLAMSMQSYHAAPTWAAEIGQPAGQTETVDGKRQSGSTTTPAEEEETSAPATGEEAAAAEGKMALIQMLPCRLFPTVCVPPVPATMIMASCRW
ncbi:MAG: hypothetical protein ACLRXQ_07200 [Phascolarctobacterium faecium]